MHPKEVMNKRLAYAPNGKKNVTKYLLPLHLAYIRQVEIIGQSHSNPVEWI